MARKNPYRLDPIPIGEGGYARVYRGVHRETGAVAAVKKVRRGDETGQRRFEREVEIQTQLDHPNVMPILDYSLEDGWLAMPLGKRTLTDAIEEDRDVDGFQLVPIIEDIARGLQHAHRQGLAHRDVNPNNALELREPEPRWVMSDWGLVRKPPGESSPRLTRRDRPLGTHGFIAPEAMRDPHGADEICDVYSLGKVAHFGVTSVWPRDSFPLPDPGWLWVDFVNACTAQDRDARAKSMSQVLRLLGRIRGEIRRMQDRLEDLICPRCEEPMTGARCDRCGRMWD